MTVFPGFGGQPFIADVVPKIELAHAAIEARALAVTIEVDGGIDATTAALTARAGARVFVAGQAIFGDPQPTAAVESMKRSVAAALASPTVRQMDQGG